MLAGEPVDKAAFRAVGSGLGTWLVALGSLIQFLLLELLLVLLLVLVDRIGRRICTMLSSEED